MGTNSRAGRGLTLLELLVVLVILVAIAGMLIPTLPSLLGRAHTSTSASALAEITNNMQIHKNLYQTDPDNFDSLLENSGAALWAAEPVASAPFGLQVLTAEQIESLNDAGIRQVSDLEAFVAGPPQAPENVTFDPYDGAAARVLAVGGNVAALTAAGITQLEEQLGDQPDLGANDFYAVFGLGQRCTAIGRTIASAPVHFAEGGAGPTVNYQRYIVVYRVSGDTEPRSAQFVGALAIHADGDLAGLGAHLSEYYEVSQP